MRALPMVRAMMLVMIKAMLGMVPTLADLAIELQPVAEDEPH
jgi:hypothetical protein